MSRYRNPWRGPTDPEFFETDVRPVAHRSFQIFQRIPGAWELVKDGVCLTQRAGRNGPRNAVDALYGAPTDTPWNTIRIREIAARYGVSLPTVADAA